MREHSMQEYSLAAAAAAACGGVGVGGVGGGGVALKSVCYAYYTILCAFSFVFLHSHRIE